MACSMVELPGSIEQPPGSIDQLRSLAHRILIYYLSRARGRIASIRVGTYCYRRGLFNPALVSALYSVIESEFARVQCNGVTFVLDSIEWKRRQRILRYKRVVE